MIFSTTVLRHHPDDLRFCCAVARRTATRGEHHNRMYMLAKTEEVAVCCGTLLGRSGRDGAGGVMSDSGAGRY